MKPWLEPGERAGICLAAKKAHVDNDTEVGSEEEEVPCVIDEADEGVSPVCHAVGVSIGPSGRVTRYQTNDEIHQTVQLSHVWTVKL